MAQDTRIQVSLDKATVESLLTGLYKGAQHKALRGIQSSHGSFYVESKELRITISADSTHTKLENIFIHNDKLYAEISAQEIASMGFAKLADSVILEFARNYSGYAHSLAENIYAFGKSYGH